MTGMSGSKLAEQQVEHPASLEFFEIASRQMLITRQLGTLNFKGREHVQVGPLVQAQSLGSQAVETHRLQESQDRRGPEAGGHPPPHVALSNILHLVN